MIDGLICALMYIRRQVDILNRAIYGTNLGWATRIFQANSSVDAWVFGFNLIVTAISECSIHSVIHNNFNIRLGQFDRLIVDLNYERIGLNIADWQLYIKSLIFGRTVSDFATGRIVLLIEE